MSYNYIAQVHDIIYATKVVGSNNIYFEKSHGQAEHLYTSLLIRNWRHTERAAGAPVIGLCRCASCINRLFSKIRIQLQDQTFQFLVAAGIIISPFF